MIYKENVITTQIVDMEYWSGGVMGKNNFQHSSAPVLQL
jgi:hypothetical protein